MLATVAEHRDGPHDPPTLQLVKAGADVRTRHGKRAGDLFRVQRPRREKEEGMHPSRRADHPTTIIQRIVKPNELSSSGSPIGATRTAVRRICAKSTAPSPHGRTSARIHGSAGIRDAVAGRPAAG